MGSHSFWSGRRAFITGASSGIGRALALHLAKCGAAVGLMARRRESLEQLVNEIRGTGGTAQFAAADVTDAEQMRAAAAALAASLGECDVAIANAGIIRDTPSRAFPAEQAAEVIATNVTGVINTIAAFVPGMVERRRGHLSAVASLAATIGLPDAGAYCASKAAVVTLMESMAVDLHRFGIRVTTINPGYVDTPLLAGKKRSELPHLVPVDQEARRIARAIERGRRTCSFPWQTSAMVRFARTMPFSLYRRVISKQAKAK